MDSRPLRVVSTDLTYFDPDSECGFTFNGVSLAFRFGPLLPSLIITSSPVLSPIITGTSS